MKRFIMILASVLLMALSAFGESGNVDGSGGVDLTDVIMSLRVCAGLDPGASISPNFSSNHLKSARFYDI